MNAQQYRSHDAQYGRQNRVHGQRQGDAAHQQYGGPDADGLGGGDEVLHVVGVRGHAGDEAGQGEGVRLTAGEAGGADKEVLPQALDAVPGHAHGGHVGKDVGLADQEGHHHHQRPPAHHRAHPSAGHHPVDDVLQYVGDQKLQHRGEKLHRHAQADAAQAQLHVAPYGFHSGGAPLPPGKIVRSSIDSSSLQKQSVPFLLAPLHFTPCRPVCQGAEWCSWEKNEIPRFSDEKRGIPT